MSLEKFNLQIVNDAFSESLVEEDDVNMDNYLIGYTELLKFFQLMGSVFSFIHVDVKTKVEILQEFRQNKENAEKFSTFKTMMLYEKDSNLFDKKDYVSGSRTLLRLHRGLGFIREFLQRLGELEPNGKTHGICYEAYDLTLAPYHPWIIRKGATVAMYALPTRDQLINKVCDDVNAAFAVLPAMLESSKLIYDRTQALYTIYDLHGLP